TSRLIARRLPSCSSYSAGATQAPTTAATPSTPANTQRRKAAPRLPCAGCMDANRPMSAPSRAARPADGSAMGREKIARRRLSNSEGISHPFSVLQADGPRLLPQLSERPREPLLDGGLGQAQHLGDLPVAQTVAEAHREHLANLGGHVGEQLAKLRGSLVTVERRVRVEARIGDELRVADLEVTLVGAEVIDDRVAGHREHPASNVPSACVVVGQTL